MVFFGQLGDLLHQPVGSWVLLVVIKFLVAFLSLVAAQRNRRRSRFAAVILVAFGLGVMLDLIHSAILKAPPFVWQDLLTYAPLVFLMFMLMTRGVEDGYTREDAQKEGEAS